MKKITLLVAVIALTFTLSSCNNRITLDIKRDTLNQENETVDSIDAMLTKIDGFTFKIEDIIGKEYIEDESLNTALAHNQQLLEADTFNVDEIMELNDFEGIMEFNIGRIIEDIESVYNKLEANPSIVENQESDVSGELFTVFVNEDYLYTSLKQDTNSTLRIIINKYSFEKDKFVNEQFRYMQLAEESFIDYSIYDSEIGLTTLNIDQNKLESYITLNEFDFINETSSYVATILGDDLAKSVTVTKVDYKNNIGHYFRAQDGYVINEGFSHYIDAIKSLQYTKSNNDNEKLIFNMKDLAGWDSITEAGYFSGDTLVKPLSTHSDPLSALTTGQHIWNNIDGEITDNDFVQVTDELTYKGTFTLEDFNREVKATQDVINEYFKQDKIVMFGNTFRDSDHFVNYMLGLIPDEYLDQIID